MVLEFKGIKETSHLICFNYYSAPGWNEKIGWSTSPLNELEKWSNEIDMMIYYCAGLLYFERGEDLINFQLRWC